MLIRLAAVWFAIWVCIGVSAAQSGGAIHGRVLTAGDENALGALVVLVELRREVTTDDEGVFDFDNLRPGRYLVNVTSLNDGGATVRVEVEAGKTAEVTVRLDRLVHSGSVSVTAAGSARGLFEVIQPVDVLGDEELVLRRQATLGETLSQQAGVSSTGYGQGSSRPVVRGLGADRVRILENGLDTGDVSSIGPDHAVGSDPLAADRIEIVRGAGTLLYGPNALGGVVNVIDTRVPDRVPSKIVTGAVELAAGTVADQNHGAAKIDGGSGHFAWHLGGFVRDAGDYSSPAPRVSAEGEHETDSETKITTGIVTNSYTEAAGATIGGSYVGQRGYLGLALSGFNTEYGVPGHQHHDHQVGGIAISKSDEHDDEEEAPVHTELEQRRVDVHGQLDVEIPGFRGLRLSAGWRDYSHEEFEGHEIGTRFENELSELRLESVMASLSGFEGTLGLHYLDRDFSAFGEEAFVQPTSTRRMAAFVYEEKAAEPIGIQLGARFERQETDTVDPDLPARDFSTWSTAGGVVYKPSQVWQLSLNLSLSERAPTAEELYSNGPHAATRAYEIGDPSLRSEIGSGLDFTFRAETEKVRGWVSLFATRFEAFIYLRPTGDSEDGFDVYQFSQVDADFWGFELHVGHELLHSDHRHLHLEFTYDQVHAELRDSGEALPRMPPRKANLALVYLGDAMNARLEGVWVDEQDRVSDLETSTPGSTIVNASISYRLFRGGLMHQFILRGRNLADEATYNHVSFLKEVAPLPGRDVSLVYRMLF
ncbi:MAG: TonB-dependent receptor [bacterium]|nr:TonB-dependent receptor [bacterium]